MENSSSPVSQATINNLLVDQKMQAYRDHKDLVYFWDLFSDVIAGTRIDKELADNAGKYYGNRMSARNTLIRHDLEDAKLFLGARETYAKLTCEKILQFFRFSVFSWSTGGKNYAKEGDVNAFKHMPSKHLEELYNPESIEETETLSELIDDVVTKISDEFHAFDAVRSCNNFYTYRPIPGKNPPIFRDCLTHVAHLAKHVQEAGVNESYFQNAGAHIRQYRDMLDPQKEIPEDCRTFLSTSDKPITQVRNDVEETIMQYLQTLISFQQMQKKGTKEELRLELNGFLAETGYTIETLHVEITPTYKNVIEKMTFKHSGWQIQRKIPKK